MKLHIITTQRTQSHDIDWIELNTPAGNMVIQHGHAPMIIELNAHEELLYQTTSGLQESIKIIQGIAHVNRDTITILLPVDL